MFALLFDLEDYATTYRATRDAYLKAANELKLATGPYKAARDAYVAATATFGSAAVGRRVCTRQRFCWSFYVEEWSGAATTKTNPSKGGEQDRLYSYFGVARGRAARRRGVESLRITMAEKAR